MPVYGQVGLMGSGKTRQIVKIGLGALAVGRDVYANFRLGSRGVGYIVPMCGRAVHVGLDHHAERYEFQPEGEADSYVAGRAGWRRGRGFVPHERVTVLTSWDQLIASRVGRDAFGVAHRLRVLRDEETGEWRSEPLCRVYDCAGCSRGITVLIDELNLWAPSRMWQELGLGVLNRWAYARKDGLEVHWSSQHESRVDKVAREVTDHIYTNSAFGGVLGRLRFQVFQRRKWIPALMTDKTRVVSAEGAKGSGAVGGFEWPEIVVRFGRNLATREEDAFDTYEHVQDSGHLASADGAERAERAERRRGSAPRAGVHRSAPGSAARAALDTRQSSTVASARPVAALQAAAGTSRGEGALRQ